MDAPSPPSKSFESNPPHAPLDGEQSTPSWGRCCCCFHLAGGRGSCSPLEPLRFSCLPPPRGSSSATTSHQADQGGLTTDRAASRPVVRESHGGAVTVRIARMDGVTYVCGRRPAAPFAVRQKAGEASLSARGRGSAPSCGRDKIHQGGARGAQSRDAHHEKPPRQRTNVDKGVFKNWAKRQRDPWSRSRALAAPKSRCRPNALRSSVTFAEPESKEGPKASPPPQAKAPPKRPWIVVVALINRASIGKPCHSCKVANAVHGAVCVLLIHPGLTRKKAFGGGRGNAPFFSLGCRSPMRSMPAMGGWARLNK